jgi:phage-related minor tail protein
MEILLSLLGVCILIGGGTFFTLKTGRISDKNKNLIPDEVEEIVQEAQETIEEIKRRTELVSQEVKDVVKEAKEMVDQAKDIPWAIKGKVRPGRKSNKK